MGGSFHFAITSLIFPTAADKSLKTPSFPIRTMLRQAQQKPSTPRWTTPSPPGIFILLQTNFPPHPLPFDGGAFHAVIFTHVHGKTIGAQVDHSFTFRTARWLEFWRIFQFFKVVFICSIVHIHFGLEIVPAFLAGFPLT